MMTKPHPTQKAAHHNLVRARKPRPGLKLPIKLTNEQKTLLLRLVGYVLVGVAWALLRKFGVDLTPNFHAMRVFEVLH